MMHACPWCGKSADYTLDESYDRFSHRFNLNAGSTVKKMSCEEIECVCPSCGGGFSLIPELKTGMFYVWVQDGRDWDQEYYDYETERRKYYEKHNPPQGRFSLLPSGGFSLPSPGKFSLFSRRRGR